MSEEEAVAINVQCSQAEMRLYGDLFLDRMSRPDQSNWIKTN